MRSLLFVLVLGALGGGLLIWLTGDPEEGSSSFLGEERGHGPDSESSSDSSMLQVAKRDVILVEPSGMWPAHLMRDGSEFMDPRALDEIEIVSPTGADYYLTGGELLDVLKRTLGPLGYQFRFEDEKTKDVFKRLPLRGSIPAEAPLRMLLDQARFAGFAFVTYAGNVYVTPADEGEIPGGGIEKAVPVEDHQPQPVVEDER